MFCKNPDFTLFNGVPEDVKAKYQPLMKHQPSSNWDGTVSYVGWDKVPSMYIVADEDNCLSRQTQEIMAGLARCKVEHVPLGHMALLSGPEQIAEKLLAFLDI